MACAILDLAIYFLYLRPFADRNARNLRLRVEGSYPCIICGVTTINDIRIRFLDIKTFSIVDDSLRRRFGEETQIMGIFDRHDSRVTIHGFVDADSVRDTLCEIGRSRGGATKEE